jgi:oligosaccharide reducing-end xylanase
MVRTLGSRFPSRLAVGLLAALGAACAAHPAPGTGAARAAGGAYATGQYPNLFVSLLGQSPAAVQARIDSAWQQLFHGDSATQAVYYPVGPDMAYVLDVQFNDVRSEGQSYGMMVAVQLDKQAEFDRIWKWTRTYLYHAGGQRAGYFAWQARPDGTIMDQTPAPDGEEWLATALFFASARWGDGQGIFNYRAEAQHVLDTALHKAPPGQLAVDSTTNLFDAGTHIVQFVPNLESVSLHLTDPSYQLPHYLELWGRWADKDNAFWCAAADSSRAFLARASHPATGLFPDYATFDGRGAKTWWNQGAADSRFDAFRVGANIGVDHAWFAKDPRLVEAANRLVAFYHQQGIDRYVNQYTLDGRPLSQDRSTGLVATNGVAALAATIPERTDFVRALWQLETPSGTYRYYDGMLYMLALLQTSGNFRVFTPAWAPRGGC